MPQPSSPNSIIQRVRVIVNPTSGRDDRPILQPLHRVFVNAGIEYELLIEKGDGDTERFASTAATDGFDAVAVYGGDGTVKKAASALCNTPTPLAILPGGTVNVLAMELDIPYDVEAAASLLLPDAHEVRAVDMLRVQQDGKEQLSIVRLSVGYLAEVVKDAEGELKDRLGRLAHTVTTLRTLSDDKQRHFTLTIDGQPYEADGATCIIANSGNVGTAGIKLDQKILVDDGLLDVVILPSSIVGGLAAFVANLTGGKGLTHWQAREVSVQAQPPADVECDGEILDATSLTVTVVPGAVNLICPKTEARS